MASTDRPSRGRISARGLPMHSVVFGAADHTAILYKIKYSNPRPRWAVNLKKKFTSGGGSPLYPEILQYYTMILQRPRSLARYQMSHHISLIKLMVRYVMSLCRIQCGHTETRVIMG